jgi:signal transduction histidine kinase
MEKEKILQLVSKRTSERELKKMLKNARTEAIRETAVTLNHKINTPLSTIILKAELLLRKNKDLDKDTKKGLMTIQEEVEKIHKTMSRLSALENAKTADYLDDVKMIDLERSTVNSKV